LIKVETIESIKLKEDEIKLSQDTNLQRNESKKDLNEKTSIEVKKLIDEE
jgi:hypothetical protein